MHKKAKTLLTDLLLTSAILLICFFSCLWIQSVFEEDSALIPAIFVLGVFLTSVITQGYLCGILAALLSVLAVNFAFTFPFFAVDFTIPENILSASILLIVTIVTCGLTTKIKHQESIKIESETERMRANLLRAISHDLRTPLTTIYGSGSALLSHYQNFSDAQREQMLKGICEDAQWLSRMVENLLSITRLDSRQVQLIKTETVLDELIDSVLVKFAKRYPSQSVLINLPDDFVVIPMDALLIEQVLLNLLENAVQHAKGMTALTLKVTVSANKAIFEVSDNGCGIPNEKMKHLFTGYGLSATAPSDGQKANAGIGLSVCAAIIRAHGSEIKVECPRKGGSIFRFALSKEDTDHVQQ